MIAGLKAGRVLRQDGWASDDERQAVYEMHRDGIIDIEQCGSDAAQYTFLRITWKPSPSTEPSP